MPDSNKPARNIPPHHSLSADIPDRETVLSALLRETDRVQRTKDPLCIILFEIDEFAHINSRLGAEQCDQLLCSMVGRTKRLLRTYDLLGCPGKAFLVGLPGCSLRNAVMLGERIRTEVFGPCFNVAGELIYLTVCLGIASSHGRSPLVVLREAEHALNRAKDSGPDSYQCVYEGLGAFSVDPSGCVSGLSDAFIGK